MVKITIDEKSYEVQEDLTVIGAIDRLGIQLPRYCYHPGLSVSGNCRICQVEIEKLPRTVIACNTRVAEGMIIRTRSAKAVESQRAVLEFLLANHPLDCPVCDQAGECMLQNYYMSIAPYTPAFNEDKVKKPKKAFAIGPTLMLDQERCILCSRCVRFCAEITRTDELGIFERADHAVIDIYPDRPVQNNYSGNLADICPVGALTDRDFRFKCRVWYLGQQKSICPGCARGCNIDIHFEKSRPVHYSDRRVMRLKPRENQSVNRWWMCDEGRYDYQRIDRDRILEPQVALKPADWPAAIRACGDALSRFKRWAVLLSPQMTNEELFLASELLTQKLGIKDAVLAGQRAGAGDDLLLLPDRNPNSRGAGLILHKTEDATALSQIVHEILAGARDGFIVFHQDLSKLLREETLRNLRKALGCLVYIGPNSNATSRMADIVLPCASYAEIDGTFTNFQGRVQRLYPAVPPIGLSRPLIEILRQMDPGTGKDGTCPSAEVVFEKLARQNRAFNGLSYASIADQGQLTHESG